MKKSILFLLPVQCKSQSFAKRSSNYFFGISILAAFFLLPTFNSYAQLGRYQFSGTAVCPNNAINVTIQPANATFGTFSSVATNCVAASNTFLTSSWNTGAAINLGEYNQFAIAPSPGYLLTLTSITFKHAVSVNGTIPTTWYIRSSLDNYTTNIATGPATSANVTPTVTLPASSFTNIGAVTFRFYITTANAGSTTWYNDDVMLYGTVVQQPATPANPTSNSPQCAVNGVTLTATGSAPATETWYWQTTATGTSIANTGNTYTAFSSGTYYIRSRNNTTLAWSVGAGSVTITATPDVGTPIFAAGSTTTRCQGAASVLYSATASDASGISYSLDAASLTAGNTIDGTTGNVTYTAGWTGTTIITATATGCSGPTTSTHTVTINPSVSTPVFTMGASSTRCQGAGAVSYTATANNTTGITYSLDATSITAGNSINATTGVVNYVAGWSGTSTIRASASGCSGPKIATHTVTTTATVGTPAFTLGASSIRCQGGSAVNYTATATNSTAISYSLDATSESAGNTINSSTGDVTYTSVWTGTSTITATAAGCNGPRTANHTVTTTASVGMPVFTLGATSTRCQAAGTVTYTATASTTTGITYSLDAASLAGANSINASTGAVTYAAGWSGTTTITASATGCNGPKTSTHIVTVSTFVTTPVFAMGATSAKCQLAETIVYSATATAASSITYILDAASIAGGNIINSSTGAVTYTAGWTGTTIITTTAAGCSGPKSATHTVTVSGPVGVPVFSLGTNSNRCQGANNNFYPVSAANNTSLTVSLDAASLAAGNTFNTSNNKISFVATWSGTSVLTAVANGCYGPQTSTHTITTIPPIGTPVFDNGTSSVRCQGAVPFDYNAVAPNQTFTSYKLDATSTAAGNSIDTTTGIVTYTAAWTGNSTITAWSYGCNSGPVTASHAVTTTPTVGVPVFSLGASSSRCFGAATINYSASSTNTTGITYSLDATSLTAGNTINAATGEVSYSAIWAGITTVTASAAGCNGPKTGTHTVTINGAVTVPVFTLGATSTRCQGTGTVTYTATATNTSSITYTLDAASISGGNSINAATGAVTFVDTWSGSSIITASAAGCLGPQTNTHSVTITPSVGTPVFTMGATSIRCQSAGDVFYTATATDNTGITYSLNAASIAAGNSINAATGDVTYVASYSGTTIITANAAGCNGPKTAAHTVTVTPTVGVPVFSLGATSSRCNMAITITYTANATNNTAISYSLDAASIAGGNSIDPITGAVSYVLGWTSPSTITATATGCNGPTQADHTVSVNAAVTIPVFTLGASSSHCQGAGAVTYEATANNTAGITYTLDAATLAAGNTINAGTGVVTYQVAWSGTSTITASAAGCYGPLTATHTVTTTPTVGTPVFSLGATSTWCQSAGTVNYNATATTNTGILYNLDATSLANGNTIDANTGDVTYDAAWIGTTIITATATGCNGPASANHTVSVNGPVTVPVFTLGSTSIRCQSSTNVTYTATSNYTSGITYTLDAASIAGGNTINAGNGTVSYAAGWVGSSSITASSAGCNGPQTSTHNVTITPTVGTPVFAIGTNSTRCQGAEVITYDATATTTTGITYSLNGPSLTAGNTINSSTGEVTYVGTYSGTTIITASAAGCNGPKTATHTVTVTPTVGTPIFSLGANSVRCQGSGTVTYSATSISNTGISYALDASSLAGGNTIISSTGAVTYVAGWTGTSFITATATGCNGPVSSNHTVTITPTVGSPVYTMGATSTRCQGAGTVPYTATATNTTGINYSIAGGPSINATSGVVTYAAGFVGTAIITASAAGCNGPSTSIHTVTVNPSVGTPVFALGATSARCEGAGTINYGANAAFTSGMSYFLDGSSLAGGNSINVSTGDVTYIATWFGTTTITASAAGCNGPVTATHTVTINQPVTTPVFTLGATSTRCQQGGAGTAITYTATANNATGMTYSLDAASIAGGNTINAATGRVAYVATWSGTSVISANATGCYGPATANHTVTTTPLVGTPSFALGTTSTRCQGAGTVNYNASVNSTSGITYTIDNASTSAGNIINASSGDVTYVATWSGTTTITASAAGCSGPRTATHTVTVTPTVGVPVFALGASSARCQSAGTINYSATATNSTGITYSLDPTSAGAGNTINPATGAVTWAATWFGTSTISATGQGCNGPSATAIHTVTTAGTLGTPAFVLGATSTRCQGVATLNYTATASNTSGLTYTLDAASATAGNTINAGTGAVTFTAAWTGTSAITVNAAGCGGSKTATHTITVTPTVGTPVFSAGASSSRCQGAGIGVYGASATNTTGVTYTLDATSLASGNTINSSTGDVSYTAGWNGSSIITATAAGCNGPRTANHTATTNAPVNQPVFTAGSTSTRCQGAGSVSYSATASNSTGLTYSLDAASLAGGNTIVAATGVVTYAATWNGSSVITASASGCFGPQPSYHTVTITPSTGTPAFDFGATSTRCQGAGTVTYNATAPNIISMTYSMDGASLTAGNTINSATGTVTFTAAWTGTTIITATALGCNGPRSTTHTVTINSTVGLPTFTLGASTTRCQGAGTVTYAASATNTTGITYSIDAASFAGGVTINATTGAVTYPAPWTGSTIITASAAGCSGPRNTNHTANTTQAVGSPVFTLGAASSRCQGVGTVTYTASATNSSGITYSINFLSIIGGCSINAATGTVSYAAGWSGTTTITASAAGCGGPRTSTHSVTVTPTVGVPVFAAGASSTRCQSGGTTIFTATSVSATSITYSLDAASVGAGNSINSANGAVTFSSGWTSSSIITAVAQGCGGPSGSATHVVNTMSAVTQPIFAAGDTSIICQTSSTISYNANASNASSLVYKLDNVSLTYPNVIDSTSGTVTWSSAWAGTSTITVTAYGCYGPTTATHTVRVLASVGPTIFSLGGTSDRCQLAETKNYTAFASNAFNITYSLDASSIGGGNSINSATGAVTFVGGWYGVSRILATSAGCSGPTTASHIVTTNLPAGSPIFTLGSNSVRCRTASTTPYLASSAFATRMRYKLDVASLAAGNTIDSTSGFVTYTDAWSGSTTITTTAVGCGAPSSTHVALTNAASCSSTLFGSTYIEKIPAGSYLINMGVVPQTAANGLKPYGLIYALLKAKIPVKWVINPQKNKDGIDFTHNGVSYRGGTLIVLAPFISASVATLVNTWKLKGVVVNTSVSEFDAEISYSLSSAPFWVMDAQNGKIAVGFMNAAEIPATAYIFKDPFQLDACDDIYVMPHADPTWATHKNLWYWNKLYHGAIWGGCHAFSVLENLYGPDVDTASVTRKMNFLMADGTAGLGYVAVPFGSHNGGTPPYVTQFPTHPIMQFMGSSDNAYTNGSEQIFLPYKPGGGWRPSTYVGIYDPSHQDIPLKSDGPAAVVAFGRAFGDPKRGFVVYEGGHNIGGTASDQVAAQRIYMNASFVFVLDKQAVVSIKNLPSAMFSTVTYAGISASVTSNIPNVTHSYKWTSSGGGTFTRPDSATSDFIAPFTPSATSVTITCEVTDNCGRVSFDTKVVPLFPSPRPPLAFNDSATLFKQCAEPSITVDVLANDFDPDGDPLSITLLGNGVNGTFTPIGKGLVTYSPNPGFVGREQIIYQVCDNTSRCATATLTIDVTAPIDANGCSANQYWGLAGKITSKRGTISNGTPRGAVNGLIDPDAILGDSSTYAFYNSSNQGIIFTLSAPIPARVGNVDTFISIFADAAAANSRFTVTQSADSITWLRSVQFTVNPTDDFTEANVKKYGVLPNTRFIRIVTNQNNQVYIDAVIYKIYSCLDALPIAQVDQAVTLEDVPVTINVLGNDADNQNLRLNVAGITQAPSFGYVALQLDGSIRYVNKKDQVGSGTDFFSYRVCNTQGLCSEAQVAVNIIADSCGAGRFKPLSLAAPIAATLSPTADAYVKVGQPGVNFGSAQQLRIKGSLDTLTQRAWLNFNTATLPPVAIIDSAILTMYLAQRLTPVNDIMNVYSATRSWTETGITWNSANLSFPWATPGGDMSPTVWASANLGRTNNQRVTWNLKSLVQSYARGGTSNMGIAVRRVPEAASGYFLESRFNSKENAANPPTLYIKYRTAGGCTPLTTYAPFPIPDTAKTNSVTPVVLDVRVNDQDYNGSGMAVSLPRTTSYRGGALSMVGNDILYTPPVTSPRYNGPDTLRYMLCSSGLCDSTYVVVNCTNAPPYANWDSYTMLSNSAILPASLTAAVMANDSDPENSTLSAPTIAISPKNGVALVIGNNIVYTPATNFIGTDTFYYRIYESGTICSVLSDTAMVVVKVDNRPPTVNNDALLINRCEIRTINILVNDIDPEGQSMSVASFTPLAAGNGSIALANNNTQFIYTPPAGGLTTNNPITFSYFAKDMYDALSVVAATVSISFRSPASYGNPIATRDTFKINRLNTLYADVLTNDYDPEGHDIIAPVGVSTAATQGTATPLSNGLVKYDAFNRFVSLDSFQYQINTSIVVPPGCPLPAFPFARNWAVVMIDNRPQADWDDTFTIKGKPVLINILRNDYFGSNPTQAGPVTIVSTPGYGSTVVLTNGSPTQANNTVVYTPNAGYLGRDQFIYSICDIDGQCDTAIVHILVKRDTDKDGIPDDLDIDDDNDGIVDVLEVCGNGAATFGCAPGGTDPAYDNDNDGIVNWQDPDYGPLNAKGCNAQLDSDGDGVPDLLDLDSDNDGIPDVVEAGGADSNGDGIIDNFSDSDADGLSQNVDASSTGQGDSGSGLGFADTDNDNVANSVDLDSDNDGIPDIREVLSSDANNDGRIDNSADNDGDGLANFIDGDIDNDGIIDNINGPLLKTGPDLLANGRASSYPYKNADRTGKPNPYDLDSDGDGLVDAMEAGFPPGVIISNGLATGARTNGWANNVRALTTLSLLNSDARGPADYVDIDSDDDGISDNIEGQSTSGYAIPSVSDTDGDGISDSYDFMINNFGGNGITPYDHDIDNIPDYLDLDTDNDGAADINEASKILTYTQSNINTGDADGDGLLDQFDMMDVSTLTEANAFRNVTNSNMGATGSFNGPAPSASNVILVRSIATGDRDWRAISVLPVRDLALIGNLLNDLGNLSWHVENEQNADYYKVERSVDGTNFRFRERIMSHNQAIALYHYGDDIKDVSTEKIYYRIQQVDINGEQRYSNIIVLNKKNVPVTKMVAYPNPVKDKMTVAITSPWQQPVQLKIFDFAGKMAYTKLVLLEKGENEYNLDNLNFPSGVYMLKATIAGRVYTVNFVKD